MTGEKMPAPNSSVPNGCAVDGASKWLVNACWVGSNVASVGGNAAAATTPVTMIAPATKLECAKSRRQERAARRREVRRATVPAVAISLVPDPRIQIYVEHVDKQIGHYEDRGRDEYHTLHQGVVPRQHAGDGQPSPPPQGKDWFCQQPAA